jgi:hypothetical protein
MQDKDEFRRGVDTASDTATKRARRPAESSLCAPQERLQRASGGEGASPLDTLAAWRASGEDFFSSCRVRPSKTLSGGRRGAEPPASREPLENGGPTSLDTDGTSCTQFRAIHVGGA